MSQTRTVNAVDYHVAIIDNIILTIDFDFGSWYGVFLQDDLHFGSGRADTGWYGLMLEMDYSIRPATAHATAEYWEVDQSVKSLGVSIF